MGTVGATVRITSILFYGLFLLLIYLRPQNFKELYNLRHASARNVVERIFGVIKHRWTILTRAPHYNMHVQAKIPSALVALHNFILEHDCSDLERWLDNDNAQDDAPGQHRAAPIDFGRLATSDVTSNAEKRRAEAVRQRVAMDMWDGYQQYLADQMDVDYYGDIQAADVD